MNKFLKIAVIIIATTVTLGCLLVNSTGTEPFTVIEDRIYILDTGLSFKLPESTWDTSSGKHQSNEDLQLISFSRNEPISFGNNQAYFPTISIIVEKLAQETSAETYDQYVRNVIEGAGMEIKKLEALSSPQLLLSPSQATGWKTEIGTAQGDSQGYMINIVHQNWGIRFILESNFDNFDTISAEYLEIIKSIELE